LFKNILIIKKLIYINIKNIYKIINESMAILDGIEIWLDVKMNIIRDIIFDFKISNLK
jgi:hypothetical protein